jgi:hypothetical protein
MIGFIVLIIVALAAIITFLLAQHKNEFWQIIWKEGVEHE